ncbi:MAG: hypothetical protein N2486_10480 [Caloramator sp.]|nr:hypothetical protein [Caloramator sp.]
MIVKYTILILSLLTLLVLFFSVPFLVYFLFVDWKKFLMTLALSVYSLVLNLYLPRKI